MAESVAFVVNGPTEARSSVDGSHVLISFDLVGGEELQLAIPCERCTEVLGLVARTMGLAAKQRSDDRDVRQVFLVEWLGVARDKASGETILTFRLSGGMEFCFEVYRDVVENTIALLITHLAGGASLPAPGTRWH